MSDKQIMEKLRYKAEVAGWFEDTILELMGEARKDERKHIAKKAEKLKIKDFNPLDESTNAYNDGLDGIITFIKRRGKL